MPVTRTRLLAMLGGCLFATGAQAAITQQITFSFDPTPDDSLNGDEVRGGDRIDGATEADIDRALIAGITGPGFQASGSVGEFGNYGLSGETFRGGELRAQVYIRADVAAPPFGGPREAEARFIIDGGSFTFIANQNSTLEFDLSLSVDGGIVYRTGFEMTGDATFVNPTVSFFGTDIGAEQDPTFRTMLDIPFSGQKASLGILDPGQVIDFEYQLDIIARSEVAEIVAFSFEDPLSLEPPPVDAADLRPSISPVPLPASAWLMLAALGAAGASFRRRAGPREGA